MLAFAIYALYAIIALILVGIFLVLVGILHRLLRACWYSFKGCQGFDGDDMDFIVMMVCALATLCVALLPTYFVLENLLPYHLAHLGFEVVDGVPVIFSDKV